MWLKWGDIHLRENQKADEVEGGESTQEEVFSAER